ncbi:hypothetical protein M422DRAFT_254287 [Sphaerobolus stellatus SS14]|uniref:Uncharacterized protein n=1 Tax=Sphaerobolus stellatus (strain SS14) TaxID=990650 RepID=A0A0C9VV95_SPHS4|nr:hypothetical protein M422DRAFT_254287 [Sphaerobolus stellatus SS14]
MDELQILSPSVPSLKVIRVQICCFQEYLYEVQRTPIPFLKLLSLSISTYTYHKNLDCIFILLRRLKIPEIRHIKLECLRDRQSRTILCDFDPDWPRLEVFRFKNFALSRWTSKDARSFFLHMPVLRALYITGCAISQNFLCGFTPIMSDTQTCPELEYLSLDGTPPSWGDLALLLKSRTQASYSYYGRFRVHLGDLSNVRFLEDDVMDMVMLESAMRTYPGIIAKNETLPPSTTDYVSSR